MVFRVVYIRPSVYELPSPIRTVNRFPVIMNLVRKYGYPNVHRLRRECKARSRCLQSSDSSDNGGQRETDLASTGGDSGRRGRSSGGNLATSGSDVGSSAVNTGTAGVAGSDGRGNNGLGDRAGAVSDGEGSSLGDGVGLVGVGQGGGRRAVGGVGSHDLSGVGDIATGRGGDGTNKSSSNSEELHFDRVVGIKNYSEEWLVVGLLARIIKLLESGRKLY